MHVTEILKTGIETIGDRGTDNGFDRGEERSAADIAKIFNAISGHNISTADAWKFLIALKLARLKSQTANGSDVTDTVVDLVNYCALLGEEVTKK